MQFTVGLFFQTAIPVCHRVIVRFQTTGITLHTLFKRFFITASFFLLQTENNMKEMSKVGTSEWMKSAVRTTAVAISGAVLGAVVSFIANCTLVEISLNPFFGFYFGVLFLFIGGIIFWRVKTLSQPKSLLLLAFSSLVIVSGLICFVLDTPFVSKFGWMAKLPLFCCLGISVVFALLFAILDIVNFFVSTCQTETSPGLIETEDQVHLILATSVFMGLVFGFVFGMLDVEDVEITHLRLAFMRDQSICYPIGAALGAIAALFNHHLASQHPKYAFTALSTDDTFTNDFDEDL